MKLYFNTDPIVYDQDYQLTMIEKAATWFWFCAFFRPMGKTIFPTLYPIGLRSQQLYSSLDHWVKTTIETLQ